MNPVRDNEMYYVYVIRSLSSNYWYTGVTNDLRKRFSQHQTAPTGWTKRHRPYELIYYEACRNMKRFLSLTG